MITWAVAILGLLVIAKAVDMLVEAVVAQQTETFQFTSFTRSAS